MGSTALVLAAAAAAASLSACGSTTAMAHDAGASDGRTATSVTDTGARDSARRDVSSDAARPRPGADAGEAGLGDAPASCVLDTTSTLPHVHIDFESTRCVFTLAQAAAKISIAYDLIVDQDVPGFQLTSAYSPPYYSTGASTGDLAISEVLSGGGQQYCLCDEGLGPATCPTSDGGTTAPPAGTSGPCPPITIPAGTYPRVFTWDGRNWNGPSDTGNPEGAPFPAGDYELAVTTDPGSIGDAGDLRATGTFLVRLVP